jgi:sterol desaturase/sphingolipid hydroxylase (fatty acid hydroxylase superfamily)
MTTEQIIPLAVPILYLLMLASEANISGRQFPTVKNWKATGFAFFLLLLFISLLIPIIVPTVWLKVNSLLNLSSWGWWGVPIGLLLTTFVAYWFHRAEHQFDFMWRVFHQLHHSAERVDIAGAFYTHPFEPAAKMIIAALVSNYVLGLDPVITASVSTLTGLLSMFQHWNISTPHWLGYLVPRPESHCLHHERDIHARNYGDLPIWDMLFGTYLNPREMVDIKVGLGDNMSIHLPKILLMQIVEQDKTPDSKT